MTQSYGLPRQKFIKTEHMFEKPGNERNLVELHKNIEIARALKMS